MSRQQPNDSIYADRPREQSADANAADQPSSDWAGEPLEGSGFEGESPEPGFARPIAAWNRRAHSAGLFAT
jgi:hypothetical protein